METKRYEVMAAFAGNDVLEDDVACWLVVDTRPEHEDAEIVVAICLHRLTADAMADIANGWK